MASEATRRPVPTGPMEQPMGQRNEERNEQRREVPGVVGMGGAVSSPNPPRRASDVAAADSPSGRDGCSCRSMATTNAGLPSGCLLPCRDASARQTLLVLRVMARHLHGTAHALHAHHLCIAREPAWRMDVMVWHCFTLNFSTGERLRQGPCSVVVTQNTAQ